MANQADFPVHTIKALPSAASVGRGRCFLAIVLDVWSRRIVGWYIGEPMIADLVLAR